MAFKPIRIVALDPDASVIHPIAPGRTDSLFTESITFHFKLSAEVSHDWAQLFAKRWKDDGRRRAAEADGGALTLESAMSRAEHDIQDLQSTINATNNDYEQQVAKEATEKARQDKHRTALRELASKLRFD